MGTQKRKTILNNPLSGVKSKSVLDAAIDSGVEHKKLSGSISKKQNIKPPIELQRKVNAEEIFTADFDSVPHRESQHKSRDDETLLFPAEEILARESSVSSDAIISIKSQDLVSIRAAKIVKLWSWLTVPASLIPLPLIDSAALIGLQIKMIAELCKCYGVPFKKESVNAIISGLLGGTATATVASGLRKGVLKHIPHVGYIASAVTEPVLNFSSTYAIGSIFIKHFESDGDLNNFNYEHVRGSFASYIEKGKLIFKFKSAKN
jgi:uncharacterized protein (DUF697 family)